MAKGWLCAYSSRMQAGGMHPTGMHYCLNYFCRPKSDCLESIAGDGSGTSTAHRR